MDNEFVIPEKPCPRCSRFVGHFDWCPVPFVWCICQTSVVPSHRYGDNPRCLYVNDSADPNRELRGVMRTNRQMVGVADCHWPTPTREDIVLRLPDCVHGLRPWDYAAAR